MRKTLSSTAATVLALACSNAHAQSDPQLAQAAEEAQPQSGDGQIGDIVVTAQRREENLQRAAAAITAVTGDTLIRQNINNLNDLTKVAPSFQVASSSGVYTSTSIRGVFSTVNNAFGDPSISINVDQINLVRPTSSRGLFYDIDRVEVLKGPQGTLYGRNATGGAINVISVRPRLDEMSGYLNAEVGNYATFNTSGAINVPIGSTAAIRGAFQTVRRSGYLSDGTDDADRQSGRLSLRVDPTSTLSIVLRGDYTQEAGKGGGGVTINRDGSFFAGERTSTVDSFMQAAAAFAASGCPTGSGRACVPIPNNQFQRNRYLGLSGTADWEVAGGSATLIVGHRNDRFRYLTAATGFPAAEDNRAKQTSIEARFASDATKPLSFIAGLYYVDNSQRVFAQFDQQISGGVIVNTIGLDGNSWAGFGQVTYSPVDSVRLVGGLRYTHERRTINASGDLTSFYRLGVDPVPGLGAPEVVSQGSRSFNATNYKVGVEWDVADRSMAYANITTGFKSGGFFLNAANDAIGNTYEPEDATSYTVGIKNRFFDNRLQVNIEGFYLKYSNQQVAALAFNNTGFTIFPQYNVGGSTIKGVEIDILAAITPTTRLTFQGQYVDGRYKDFRFLTSLSNFAPISAQTGCSASQPVPLNAAFTRYQVDCSGKRPLQSPLWSFTTGVEQTIPLDGGDKIILDLRTFFETKRYTFPSYLPFTVANGGTRTTFNLTYTHDQFSVTGYIDNIENRAARQIASIAAGAIRSPYATLRPPRTYGVRVGMKF